MCIQNEEGQGPTQRDDDLSDIFAFKNRSVNNS